MCAGSPELPDFRDCFCDQILQWARERDAVAAIANTGLKFVC